MRYSDDDGHTWSKVKLIEPLNDPTFRGVGHIQGCEMETGTWLLGTYHIRGKPNRGRGDRQYVLRSTDQGETWTLVPGPRPNGWCIQPYDRMLEGETLPLGGARAVMFARVPSGRIWELRTEDDGLTWTDPVPTTMVHPDAPPMVFWLDGRERMVSFIHRIDSGGSAGTPTRLELWVCISTDEGRTWGEERLLLANAAAEGFGNREVCYADLLVDGQDLHLIFDHGKRQVLQVHLQESDLEKLPTHAELTELIP
jgi:hypothetical protein